MLSFAHAEPKHDKVANKPPAAGNLRWHLHNGVSVSDVNKSNYWLIGLLSRVQAEMNDTAPPNRMTTGGHKWAAVSGGNEGASTHLQRKNFKASYTYITASYTGALWARLLAYYGRTDQPEWDLFKLSDQIKLTVDMDIKPELKLGIEVPVCLPFDFEIEWNNMKAHEHGLSTRSWKCTCVLLRQVAKTCANMCQNLTPNKVAIL